MSGQSGSGEGPGNGEGQNTVDIGALQERVKQLESTNSRLLGESNDYKTKYSTLKTEVDEGKKKAMDGDTKAQLDFERKERERIEGELKETRKETLKNKVRQAVGKFAKDVHDLEDVMNQPQFAHILAKGVDQDKLTVDENAAKDYVNKVFEAKPWLKKNLDQANVENGKPKAAGANSNDYSSMSSKDIMSDILNTKL